MYSANSAVDEINYNIILKCNNSYMYMYMFTFIKCIDTLVDRHAYLKQDILQKWSGLVEGCLQPLPTVDKRMLFLLSSYMVKSHPLH